MDGESNDMGPIIKDYALRVNMTDDPYIRLAEAIVVRACDDYRNPKEALRGMGYYSRPTPDLKDKIRAEVVRFIRSDWFQLLTTLDPELLIEKLRGEQRHV